MRKAEVVRKADGDRGSEDAEVSRRDDPVGSTGTAEPPSSDASGRRAVARFRNLPAVAWLRQFRASRAGGLVVRLLIAVIGTAVIVGGIVLLPLPGPGWLIIFTGLGILSLEFAWAGRVLRFARVHVRRWERWYLAQGWTLRIIFGLLLAALVGGILLLTASYTFGWSTIVRWWHLLPGT